jgi:hypothetical protein
MEQGRAMFHEDLTQIVELAAEQVTLGGVSDGGSSVSVSGSASSEDNIFSYARALREGGRFSEVWINSITSSTTGFTFELALKK